jgi:hypothetical protein
MMGERVRAIPARATAVDPQRLHGLAGHRLHRPAVQLRHLTSRNRARIHQA